MKLCSSGPKHLLGVHCNVSMLTLPEEQEHPVPVYTDLMTFKKKKSDPLSINAQSSE